MEEICGEIQRKRRNQMSEVFLQSFMDELEKEGQFGRGLGRGGMGLKPQGQLHLRKPGLVGAMNWRGIKPEWVSEARTRMTKKLGPGAKSRWQALYKNIPGSLSSGTLGGLGKTT